MKFRAKSSEREGNAWVLGWRKCIKTEVLLIPSLLSLALNVLHFMERDLFSLQITKEQKLVTVNRLK